MTYTVYVLGLEGGRFYVGRTRSFCKRMAEHRGGKGAAWTNAHRLVRCVEKKENCDEFDEDKATLRYMAKHGVDNVRGGAYVTMRLSSTAVAEITRRIRMSTDRCVRCGSRDHYVSACALKTTMIYLPGCERCRGRDHFTADCRVADRV